VHGPVLGRLRVGMNVVEADTGRTIFRRRGTALMDPASNQKVLATTTALMRLGADFRFRTELSGPPVDNDGVLRGNVVLRGSGDPSLRASDLEALAAQVATQGVTRIDGGVLADPRRLGATEEGQGERAPLRVANAAITVRVRPGGKVGERPVVTVRPMPEAFAIANRATTRASGRSRVKVELSSANGQMVVTVGGNISMRHPGLVLRRMPPNPRLFAATLLRAALVDAGIEVSAPAGILKPAPAKNDGKPDEPGTPPTLAVHESDPLSTLIRRINKDSDNEWADRLLEVVGAELFGGAATAPKGVRALREAMEELGLPARSYVPTNGSGLGHGNRVTADAMADLLRKLYTDPRWGPELVQSLSIGGVDGTTRNRFRGSPAAERVRAKTGTLQGKSCLSGYVGDGHEILVFSILVDGLRGRKLGLAAVRAAQVNAVNAMMRYARGVLGAPPEDENPPGMDLETGEEEQDGEEDDTATPDAGATPTPTPTPTSAPAPAVTSPINTSVVSPPRPM
jgi:D-alanyl-D-alanine carboxypeptidase/D-alanyl-D-alanine-endopeptidase (penicillin-binding protein 4)